MDRPDLADALRSTREALGLTRRALADQVGVSESYIGLLETGRKWDGLTSRHLRALADALRWDAARRASIIGTAQSLAPAREQL